MCHVKVVLLCKGRGGDAASYRPTRDESQWWNRRDALVRCVSSFLHGPWSAHCSSRELVLLHDEDFARIHMSVTNPLSCRVLPTEQNVVSAWKASASSVSKDRYDSPWACRVERVQETGASTSAASAVQLMDSKRQVLEHIQAHCSIEFLRQNGLNSKPDVILRKTNKKSLVQVWHQWTSAHKPSRATSSTSPLESIFTDLLQVQSSHSVVAGYLHESCESELPCFDPPALPAADPNLHVVLFLGAVRDMHPFENATLRRVCAAQKVPLTGIRLGAVPEFTSKILSVVAFHHAQGVLGPALVHQSKIAAPSASPNGAVLSAATTPTCLRTHMHVLCSVPLRQDGVSSALANRQSALWAMVRVTVATLWRSHYMRSSIGSGDLDTPHSHDHDMASSTCPALTTSLTFLLVDGSRHTFEQATLVTSMAENHQAAPTEFQILDAIVKQVQVDSSKKSSDDASLAAWVATAVAPSIVLDLDESNDAKESSSSLVEAMYASSEQAVKADCVATVAVLLSLGTSGVLPTHEALRRAVNTLGFPIVRQKVVAAPVQDAAAASITMLQHFAYQNRLVGVLTAMSKTNEGKKAQKHKKAKKKSSRCSATDDKSAKKHKTGTD
ncbi:hypothetical protein DYB32_001692 [Aphanomyces invadans]|uniref:Uncharacterized protein n=1 Tax=Aphanomyces invadans TaxID=157072 RepID=A0A418B5W8_9STRA|nr:hypothetical protein DYB32_001692 [Aphanomyces invadans]